MNKKQINKIKQKSAKSNNVKFNASNNSSLKSKKTSSHKTKNNFVSSTPSSSLKGRRNVSKNDSALKTSLIVSLSALIGISACSGAVYGLYILGNNETIYHEASPEVSPSYNFEVPEFNVPANPNDEIILSRFTNKLGGSNRNDSSGVWSGKVNSTYLLDETNSDLDKNPLFGIAKNNASVDSDYLYSENISTSNFTDQYSLFRNYEIKEYASATVDKYIWLNDESSHIEVEYIENLSTKDINGNELNHTSFVLQFLDSNSENVKIKFEKIGDYSAKVSKGKLFNPNFYIWDNDKNEWVADISKDENGNEYHGKIFEEKISEFEQVNGKNINQSIKEVYEDLKANDKFEYDNNDRINGLLLPFFDEVDKYSTYENRTTGNSYSTSNGIWHGELNSTYDVDESIDFNSNEFGINWIDSSQLKENRALFLRDISTNNFNQEYSNIFKVNDKNIIDIIDNSKISVDDVYYFYDQETSTEIQYIQNLNSITSNSKEVILNSLRITTNLNKENEITYELKEVNEKITDPNKDDISIFNAGIYNEFNQYKAFSSKEESINWLYFDFKNITGISIQEEIDNITGWANDNLQYNSEFSSIEDKLISIDSNNQYLPNETNYKQFSNYSNKWIDSKSTGLWNGKYASNNSFANWEDNNGKYNQNSVFGIPLLSDSYINSQKTNSVTIIKDAENKSFINQNSDLHKIVDNNGTKIDWNEINTNSPVNVGRYIGAKSNLKGLIENGVDIDWGIDIELINNFEVDTKENGRLHMNSLSIRRIQYSDNSSSDNINEKLVVKKLWNNSKVENHYWIENVKTGNFTKLEMNDAINWIDELILEITPDGKKEKKITSLNDLFDYVMSEKQTWDEGKDMKNNDSEMSSISLPRQMNKFENSNNLLVDDNGQSIIDDESKEQKLYDHIEGKFQSTSSIDDNNLSEQTLFGPKTVEVISSEGNSDINPELNTMIYYEDVKIDNFNDKVFGLQNYNSENHLSSTSSPSMFKMPDEINQDNDNFLINDNDFHFSDGELLNVEIDSILQMEVQGGYLFPANKKDGVLNDINWRNSVNFTKINGFKGENKNGDKFDIDFVIVKKCWDSTNKDQIKYNTSWVYYKYGVEKNDKDLLDNSDDYHIYSLKRKGDEKGKKYWKESSNWFNDNIVLNKTDEFSLVVLYDSDETKYVGINYYVSLMERTIYSSANDDRLINWKYMDW